MKKIFIAILLVFALSLSVYAANKEFKLNLNTLNTKQSKSSDITQKFNYQLTYSLEGQSTVLEREIELLSRKVTYLLFGEAGNQKETSEEYYKRKHDYLELRYNPDIPKDSSTFSGYDENSQEYKDDLVSGISLPLILNIVNEMEIIYKSIDNIRVFKSGNDLVISEVTLLNITHKEENITEPMKYDAVRTNLVMYYFFKELKGEYKLYYLMGETKEGLEEFLLERENNEKKGMLSIAPSHRSDVTKIYNYSKLEKLEQNKVEQIYNENSKNILYLTAIYNNYVVASANAFFIDSGLVVTTWNFLEKSLREAQYITITSGNNSYLIDGIVTVNPNSDIAVIKLKENISNKVVLGESDRLNFEDPIITLSSKTAVGLTASTGILITNDKYLQTTLPLVASDEGSPLFNESGEVIGMNTSKSINTSLSIAIPSKAIKEIKDTIKEDFNSLKTISFDKLKEDYYYGQYAKEKTINNISKNKWQELNKKYNLEETIKLPLLKASNKKNIFSLRYKNNLAGLLNGMQLSLSFQDHLIKNNYKLIVNGTKKKVYTNNNQRVTIIDEFDYLIIIVVN